MNIIRSPGPGILLVANWDSGVGYAWWLMESYWRVLAEHYAARCSVYLAYPSISTLPENIASAPLLPCVLDFRVRGLRSLLQILRFLWVNQIRLLYLTDRALVSPWYVLYRLVGVRSIVVHDHTPGLRTIPTGAKRALKRVLARLPWVWADALIGATQFVSRRHLEVGLAPASKCFCVPNGLPDRLPAEVLDVHRMFGVPKDRVIIVTVSRAHRYKGIEFALSVMRELHRERTTVQPHYLFCGDGPDLGRFKEYARINGIFDCVTFAGRRDDIRSILRGCDIAMHPSEGEVGYSLSILEYMEAQLPVVVPDNASVCEATEDGETGFRYRQGDIADAASRLTRLLVDPDLRHQLGEQAAQRLQQKYRLCHAHERLIAATQHLKHPPAGPAP